MDVDSNILQRSAELEQKYSTKTGTVSSQSYKDIRRS